jgi:hypothetical protein
VRTRVDAVLRDEAQRFALRFACEDCAHWVASKAGAAGVCANGWPERVEKDALVAPSTEEVAFCKEFELGAPA